MGKKIECKSVFGIDKRKLGFSGSFLSASFGVEIDPKRMQHISEYAQMIDERQLQECKNLQLKGIEDDDPKYEEFVEKNNRIRDTLFLIHTIKISKIEESKISEYVEGLFTDLLKLLNLEDPYDSQVTLDTNTVNEHKKIQNILDYVSSILDNQIIIGCISNKYLVETLEADMEFDLRHYEKAIDEYNKVLSKDEQNLEVLNKIGQTYFQMGEFNRSKETYQKIIDINSDDDNAMVMLGLQMFLLYLNEKEIILPRLDEIYRKAISINPQNALAHYFLAANCSWRNEDNEAKTLLIKAMEYHPPLKELFLKHDSTSGKPFERFKNDPELQPYIT